MIGIVASKNSNLKVLYYILGKIRNLFNTFLEAVKEYNPILPASPPKMLTTLYSKNQQQQTLLTQLFQLALLKVHNLKRQTAPLSSVSSLTSTP